MTNWTIFLLHFVAGVYYIKGAVEWCDKNTNDLGAILYWVTAIACTVTAAWI